ncbi:beta strand repeat-containing protein, partial [Thermodesulfobacteriota bacterium]
MLNLLSKNDDNKFNSDHILKYRFIFVFFSFFIFYPAGVSNAADPGLPFTEDFIDTNLKDSTKTNANWSTDDQAVYLAWRKQIYGALADPDIWDIGSEMDGTEAIALGDLDGDGDLDLVAGNLVENTKLYLNNGSEIPFFLVNGTEIGPGNTYTYAIALGDMDLDGDLDVVTGNSNRTNKLYLNDGTGVFFDEVSIGPETDNTYSIALGDVDGDGDLDVFAGNNGQTNKLYLNNGTADPFSGVTGTDIRSDTDDTRAIALGDVDSDGDLDVVTGNWYQSNNLYLNDGTGVFSNGTQISLETNGTTEIAIGDLNGDGKLDVVEGIYGSRERLYLNDGAGDPFDTVESGTLIGSYNQDITWAIALGDIDGDGDLDLVTGTQQGKTDKLFLNDGTGVFSDGTNFDMKLKMGATQAILLGDVDGDGDLDVVRGVQESTNKLYLNNGNANPFNKVVSNDIGSETDITHSIVLGDVDGDGYLDVVTGNNNKTNKLYLNNGTSDPFSGVTGTDISSDMDSTRSITLGDMDNNGYLDVIAGNFNQANKLYLNDGVGDPFDTVGTGTAIGTDTDNTQEIVLGYVNNDEYLDVIAGNYNETNKLYLNNTTGDPFSGVTGTDISSDADFTYAIALGDVDNDPDPDLDLVVGNSGGRKLYLNNGTSTPFNEVVGTSIGIYGTNTQSIALGDVDGDNDLDLVEGDLFGSERLYFNDGTGIFSDEGPINQVVDGNIDIALGDVDGDGDLDLVAGNASSGSESNYLYLNDGTGVFSDVSAIGFDWDDTQSIALGDVDNDGDLDVIVGNYNQADKLYLNQSTLLIPDLLYNTGHGIVASLEIDTESLNNISNATLTAVDLLYANTRIDYFLSNNGGERFYQVYSGQKFIFPTQGNDLRWRAELHSLSPLLTPEIQQVTITTSNTKPEATAGGTLEYTEDDPATPIDGSITVTDTDNANLEGADIKISLEYKDGEDKLGFTDTDEITGSWNSETGVLTLSGTSSVENYQAALRSVTYLNISDNPSETDRTVEFTVTDGELTSDAVTSTVNVTRTNDPPVIEGHDPDPASTTQNTPLTLLIGTPPAPAGYIYLSIQDPDNNPGEIELLPQPGENYYVQSQPEGKAIVPIQDYYGLLSVPVIANDGTDYSPEPDYTFSIEVLDELSPSVVSIARLNSNPTNAGEVTFAVTFSESVSGVTTDDFDLTKTGTITGGTIYSVTGSGDSYTVAVDGYSGEGSLQLVLVDNDSIVDLSSNPLGGAGSGNGDYYGAAYNIDMVTPTATIVRATASPTSLSSVDFVVTFSEAVIGVDKYDFVLTKTVNEGSVESVSGSGSNYIVTVTGYNGAGNLRLDVIGYTSILDILGNNFAETYTGGEVYDIDMVAPYVASITRADANPSNASSVNFTVTFSEDVTGVDTSDFVLDKTVTGGFVTSVTPQSNSVYTVTVDAYSGEGTIRLDVIDDDSIVDALGTPLGGIDLVNGDYTSGEIYNIDFLDPYVVSISAADANPTKAVQVNYTVTFNESVTGVTIDDFYLSAGGNLLSPAIQEPIAGSGSVYTVTIGNYNGEGTLQLMLSDDDSIQDALLNPLGGTGLANGDYTFGDIYEIDTVYPEVTSIIRADANPTTSGSVKFTVTFSEAVTGVDTTDFVLFKTVNEGIVESVTGSGSVYTVTVSGYSGVGTLRLDITDNDSIVDAKLNSLGGPDTGNGDYTVGEVYDIDMV